MANHTPPKGVQQEAAKAVQWITDGLAGDGFTATGRRRAQQLADGEAVSEDVVRRMASYFARHEPDTHAKGFNRGEPGFPTPGRVAWSAWGGDPGRTWAESTLSSLDSEAGRGTSQQMTDETRDVVAEMPDASTYALVPQPPAQDAILAQLRALFEANFAHYATAHGLHWNVLGYNFPEQHAFLQGVYEAAWARVDDIAEWIRRFDAPAPTVLGPGGTDMVVADFCEAATVLLGQVEDFIALLKGALVVANAANEQGLVNFLAELQDESQKRRWMLRSILTAIGDEAEEDGIPEGTVVLDQVEGTDLTVPQAVVAEVEPAGEDPAPLQPRSLEVDCEYRRTDSGVDVPLTERRLSERLELRAEGDRLTVEGYATVYNYPYDIAGGPEAGGFRETIARGATAKSAKEADVVLLVDHEGTPLARTKSGTLQLESDDIGLRVRAELDPANPKVAELRSAMSRGDMNAMSFAFRVVRDAWDQDYTNRTISEVKLHDVSVVGFPANPATVATLRSEDDAPATGRSLDLARRQLLATEL